jgi:hypothetical protein
MRILFLIFNKASLCGMSGDMLLARHRLEPMPNATISFSVHYAEQGDYNSNTKTTTSDIYNQ